MTMVSVDDIWCTSKTLVQTNKASPSEGETSAIDACFLILTYESPPKARDFSTFNNFHLLTPSPCVVGQTNFSWLLVWVHLKTFRGVYF